MKGTGRKTDASSKSEGTKVVVMHLHACLIVDGTLVFECLDPDPPIWVWTMELSEKMPRFLCEVVHASHCGRILSKPRIHWIDQNNFLFIAASYSESYQGITEPNTVAIDIAICIPNLLTNASQDSF